MAFGDLQGCRAERPAAGGRQRTVEHDCAVGLVDVDDQRHFAGRARQFAVVVGDGYPIADPESQELVTSDAVDRKRRLRAAYRDVPHDGND